MCVMTNVPVRPSLRRRRCVVGVRSMAEPAGNWQRPDQVFGAFGPAGTSTHALTLTIVTPDAVTTCAAYIAIAFLWPDSLSDYRTPAPQRSGDFFHQARVAHRIERHRLPLL